MKHLEDFEELFVGDYGKRTRHRAAPKYFVETKLLGDIRQTMDKVGDGSLIRRKVWMFQIDVIPKVARRIIVACPLHDLLADRWQCTLH